MPLKKEEKMKFSYLWLKDHLETYATPQEIVNKLCEIGFEVENLEDLSIQLKDIIVARIESIEDHPQADKLHVCRVFDGQNILQIVCGAQNIYKGMKTALVRSGGFVPKFEQTLNCAKIRGIESQGMMCSFEELCLEGDSFDGIIDLKTEASPGDSLVDALDLNDPVFTVSITPNRGDCFSVRGLARELAAAQLGKLKPLNYSSHFEDLQSVKISTLPKSPIAISIETASCPFFIGAVMKNVHNSSSPLWIQKRLKIAGQRPLDALIDITNFLNFDIGQPLHVYDCQRIEGSIHVRYAQQGECLDVLNGQECKLSENDIVIADDVKPLTLAGIMGGEASGCSLKTKEIFLEAACFSPVSTTLSGQRHNLHSESRIRFERGIDSESIHTCLEWALTLIQKICGGTLCGCTQQGRTKKDFQSIFLTKSRIDTLSGDLSVSLQEAEVILNRLGFSTRSENTEQLTVTIPSWRHDISREEDLIEEILRMRGYAQLPIKPLPLKPLNERKNPLREIKKILCKQGMNEVYTLPFCNAAEIELFSNHKSVVEVLKPLNLEKAFLQTSLVPALLKVVSFNQSHHCPYGAIFEIESVFSKQESFQEKKMVCGMRFGFTPRHWLENSRKVDVFDSKADLLALLKFCRIESFQIKTENLPLYYHPNRSGSVVRGKEILGYFGELHPSFVKKLGLEFPTTMFELFLSENLFAKITKTEIKPFHNSIFQPVERDFAFIVDKWLPTQQLIETIRRTDSKIVDVRVFDVFSGKNIEFDKKSIAVEVIFQPLQQTFTDDILQVMSQKIIHNVKEKCGGVLRDV